MKGNCHLHFYILHTVGFCAHFSTLNLKESQNAVDVTVFEHCLSRVAMEIDQVSDSTFPKERGSLVADLGRTQISCHNFL